MEFSHSLEQADHIARKAFALMKQRAIIPNPNNYTLWYGFASEEFPDLNQAMEIILDSQHRLSEEQIQTLFRTFYASPLDAIPIYKISEKVEAELSTVLTAVEARAQAASAYETSLQQAGDAIEQMVGGENLRLLILAILRKTRAISQQSRDLDLQLRQSLEEIGQLRRELEGAKREALTDSLTGLANRKMFDSVLREGAIEAMECGSPLALIMLDIDHFKTFNDTYGHVIGDQVLKLLAATLKECIKGQDTAARYGGEEFAIILPRTALRDAATLAEQIRQRLAGKSVVHKRSGNQLGRVNVSMGIAQFSLGEPLRKFVDRADQALYIAKKQGRNRVVCEDDPHLISTQAGYD